MINQRTISQLQHIARILLWRLVQALFVAFSVGTLCFFAAQSLDGDMAYRIAGGRYGYDLVDTQAAQAVYAELGLHQSMWVRFIHWLGDSLTFNLGNSLVSGTPVITELKHTLGHSFILALFSLFLSLMIAIPLGIFTANKRFPLFDKTWLIISVSLKSIPAFVLGILLMIVFAIQLQWLPAAGHGELKHVVLPSLTLALGLAAVSSQVVRERTIATTNSTYFQFARIKGLTPLRAFHHHGWRNMLAPVVAFVGIQFVTLVEGVVVVESLFAWPGIGHALVHAIFARDIPVIQGAAMVMGMGFVIINTFVDILVLLLNPASVQKS